MLRNKHFILHSQIWGLILNFCALQVHGATLLDGMKVAVKVQHRGMENLMRSDLRNIVWVLMLHHVGCKLIMLNVYIYMFLFI